MGTQSVEKSSFLNGSTYGNAIDARRRPKDIG